MKKSLLILLALVFVVGLAADVVAQLAPPVAGTDDTFFTSGNPIATRKRVGIVAYCADMYHNAGDTGLQSNKKSIVNRFQKFHLADLADNGLLDGSNTDPVTGNPFMGNWFLDGPFSNLGQYGAQNLADYLAYDDGIDRVRDIQVIDGDVILPTAQQLINNFDIVIAYTDNKCGPTLNVRSTSAANAITIRDSATNALTGFINAPGKKLILTGFAFSTDLGFGNALYAAGMSPLTKGGPQNYAACNRDPLATGCFIGTCPSGCTNVGSPPECVGPNGICTVYQPVVNSVLGGNQACREFLNNVRGPTSSSWATQLSSLNVNTAGGANQRASLCINYDSGPADGVNTNVPFLAINALGTIVAINAFPPDAVDIQKFWFGCLLGDVVQYLSGNTQRCNGTPTDNPFCY